MRDKKGGKVSDTNLLELNLYDMNKQIMNTKEPLSQKNLNSGIAEIASWFSYVKNGYYMLLCHEKRDYTILALTREGRYYEASRELQEILENRGSILAIDYEDGIYPIWIRTVDGENCLYHLFPYDMGVVEV